MLGSRFSPFLSFGVSGLPLIFYIYFPCFPQATNTIFASLCHIEQPLILSFPDSFLYFVYGL